MNQLCVHKLESIPMVINMKSSLECQYMHMEPLGIHANQSPQEFIHMIWSDWSYLYSFMLHQTLCIHTQIFTNLKTKTQLLWQCSIWIWIILGYWFHQYFNIHTLPCSIGIFELQNNNIHNRPENATSANKYFLFMYVSIYAYILYLWTHINKGINV